MLRGSFPMDLRCEGNFGAWRGDFPLGLEVCGTSRAPSPTQLRFGVLSPMDLGCEGVSLFRG